MTTDNIGKYALYRGKLYIIDQVSSDRGVLLKDKHWVLDANITAIYDKPLCYMCDHSKTCNATDLKV
jgi:hypothetical protein